MTEIFLINIKNSYGKLAETFVFLIDRTDSFNDNGETLKQKYFKAA